MSPSIAVDRETYDRLQFAARVAGIPIQEVVRRLVNGGAQHSPSAVRS